MKILIDCSNLKVGGGIQVALSFLYDLREMKNPESLVVLMSPQFAQSLDQEDFGQNFYFFVLDKKYYGNLYRRGKAVKKLERHIKPDAIFTVFGPSYHKSNFPKVVGFAMPHYIYEDSPFFDLIPIFKKIGIYFRKKIRIGCFQHNSNYLIFETEDARNIFCKKYNYKIENTVVVPNCLNQVFLYEEKWGKRNFDFQAENIILCLSANYKHKNLDILPDVIDHLRNDFNFRNFKFVVSQSREELDFGDEYDSFIEYIGKVPLDELPALYQSVDLLFMPTLLEIFSTTYLEAMFMEVPIVTSDLSFAKDVCASGALYFDPMKASDCSESIFKVLTDKELSKKLVKEGQTNLKRFGNSMGRTKKYLEIIEQARHSNGLREDKSYKKVN